MYCTYPRRRRMNCINTLLYVSQFYNKHVCDSGAVTAVALWTTILAKVWFKKVYIGLHVYNQHVISGNNSAKAMNINVMYTLFWRVVIFPTFMLMDWHGNFKLVYKHCFFQCIKT
jgi:hypothetical protein